MSNKRNSGAATGTEATAQPQAIDLLKSRLQILSKVQNLVKARESCQTHLDFLDSQELEDPGKEFGFESHEPQKIVLHFGSMRGESYDIKNNVLLSEVREFVSRRIRERMHELDKEIMSFNL